MSVYLKSQKIIKEWVDYNNHLNMAYYILIFDQALEIMLEKFKMGADSAKNEKRSTMVVEINTKYINEIKQELSNHCLMIQKVFHEATDSVSIESIMNPKKQTPSEVIETIIDKDDELLEIYLEVKQLKLLMD